MEIKIVPTGIVVTKNGIEYVFVRENYMKITVQNFFEGSPMSFEFQDFLKEHFSPYETEIISDIYIRSAWDRESSVEDYYRRYYQRLEKTLRER